MDTELLFFDTTSVTWEIDDEDGKASAVQHRVLPGNTVGGVTVHEATRDLADWRSTRCLLVGHSGTVWKENLRAVAAGDVLYKPCLL